MAELTPQPDDGWIELTPQGANLEAASDDWVELPPPTGLPLPALNEMHPDITKADRAVIKNFLDTDPKYAALFLQSRMGPEYAVVVDENNEVTVKKKGEERARKLEPTGIIESLTNPSELVQDVTDVSYDIAQGIGASGAALGGATLGGPAAGVGAGFAAASGLDLLKQGIARELSGQPLDPGRMKGAGLTEAAANALFGFGGKQATGMVQDTAAYLAPRLGELASGVPTETIKTAARNLDIFESGATPIVEQARGEMKTTLGEAQNIVGEKLNAAYRNITGGIDGQEIVKPFLELKNKLEALWLKNPDSEVLPDQIAAIEDMINMHFKNVSTNMDGESAFYYKRMMDAESFQKKIKGGTKGRFSGMDVDTQDLAMAADKASKVAQEQLSKASNMETKLLNKEYADIKTMQDTFDKYTKSDESAERTLRAALRTTGVRAEKLDAFDKKYGTNIVEQARKLDAYETFADPSMLPVSRKGTVSTGRISGLMGSAGMTGATLGRQFGASSGLPFGEVVGGVGGAVVGTGVGLGMSSLTGPAAIKKYMQANRNMSKMLDQGAQYGFRPAQQTPAIAGSMLDIDPELWTLLQQQEVAGANQN